MTLRPRALVVLLASLIALLPAVAHAQKTKPAKPGKAPAQAPAPAVTELNLRHDLGGGAAAGLSDLVMKFNEQQQGRGMIRLQSAVRGEPDPHLPHLALFDPTETLQLFGTRPRMQVLDDVMRRGGSPLASASLLPQLADTVDDANGKLEALPLGMSIPVLYIDVGKYRKAGLNPNDPPKTWWDLQQAAGKLYDIDIDCPLTTSYFSWVHIENLISRTGEPFVATVGKGKERVIANSMVSVKHLALITSWQKSRYFHYFGAGREGDDRFLSGECAMITSASSLNTAIRSAGMDVRVAPLPYHGDVYGEKAADLIPDGDSLWVLHGTTLAQDQLIARFVRFLLEPETQRQWVRRSGFLPMTMAAIDALRQAPGFDPTFAAAIGSRLGAPKPRGARIKSGLARERFRRIFGEEIDPVWKTGRAPKEALDRTVSRMDSATEPTSLKK